LNSGPYKNAGISFSKSPYGKTILLPAFIKIILSVDILINIRRYNKLRNYPFAMYCTNLIIVYAAITNSKPMKEYLMPFFHFDAAASSLAVIRSHHEYINPTATTDPMKNVLERTISCTKVFTFVSG
jgi:hypothetical protein